MPRFEPLPKIDAIALQWRHRRHLHDPTSVSWGGGIGRVVTGDINALSATCIPLRAACNEVSKDIYSTI